MEITWRIYCVGRGTHACFRAFCQQLCNGNDQRGLDQRLVALYIDHNGVVRQFQQVAGLRKPVAATGMSNVCKDKLDTVRVACIANINMVRRNHHPNIIACQCPRHLGALRNTDNHRHACNIGQWLVRQTGGGKARGNQYRKAHRGMP